MLNARTIEQIIVIDKTLLFLQTAVVMIIMFRHHVFPNRIQTMTEKAAESFAFNCKFFIKAAINTPWMFRYRSEIDYIWYDVHCWCAIKT